MINISASDLRKKSPRAIAVKREIEAICIQINTKIAEADRINSCEIKYYPQLLFSIPGMDNSDAQRLIFGRVIEAIEEKEYDIETSGTNKDDSFHFTISWYLDCSKKEIKKYNAILQSHHERYKSVQNIKEIETRKLLEKIKTDAGREYSTYRNI